MGKNLSTTVFLCASTFFSGSPQYVMAQSQQVGSQELNHLTYQEMTELMNRFSPAEILDIKGIEKAVYDAENKTLNLDDLFENTGLFFVYEDVNDANDPMHLANKRNAVSYRTFAENFGKNMDFAILDLSGYVFSEKKQILKLLGMKEAVPRMFLYSRYDLLKGETREKNEGKLKIVDAYNIYGFPRRGRHHSNRMLVVRTNNILESSWLQTHFSPNGKYVNEFDENGELKKVYY